MSAKEEWWVATADDTEELILGPFSTEKIANMALGYAFRKDLCVIKAVSVPTMSVADVLSNLSKVPVMSDMAERQRHVTDLSPAQQKDRDETRQALIDALTEIETLREQNRQLADRCESYRHRVED